LLPTFATHLFDALAVKEVQMPPTFGAGVMGRAKLAALWTSKTHALPKIQLQKESARFAFKSTFRYFPSRLELQGAWSCKAAVNNASGVIAPVLFPLAGIYKVRQ
jgi:hypothetical protein